VLILRILNSAYGSVKSENNLVGTKVISLEQDPRSRVSGIGKSSLNKEVEELGLVTCGGRGCSVVGDCDILNKWISFEFEYTNNDSLLT